MNVYYNEKDAEIMIYKILNKNHYDRYNMRNQMSIKQKWRNEKELRKEEKKR